jgi:hypothetical protein
VQGGIIVSKFTEGPWGVSRHDQGDGKTQFIIDADHCTIVYSVSGTDPEANAALIAAAPDMYAALLRIKEDQGWMWLDTVLAKAEGRTAIKEGK